MNRRDPCPECGRYNCSCRPTPPPTRQWEPPVYRDPPADPHYVAEIMAELRLRLKGIITQQEMERGAKNADLRARHVEMAKARKLWREPIATPVPEIVRSLAGALGKVGQPGRPKQTPEPTKLL